MDVLLINYSLGGGLEPEIFKKLFYRQRCGVTDVFH